MFSFVNCFFISSNDQTINSMVEKLTEKELWIGAITVASSSEGNINIINSEIKTNLLNLYNLKINLFLIVGVIPIKILIFLLNQKK